METETEINVSVSTRGQNVSLNPGLHSVANPENVEVMLKKLRALGVEYTFTHIPSKLKTTIKKTVSLRSSPRDSRRNSLK